MGYILFRNTSRSHSGSTNCVLHQNGNCHGPYASGIWSDSTGNGLHGFEVNIANQTMTFGRGDRQYGLRRHQILWHWV